MDAPISAMARLATLAELRPLLSNHIRPLPQDPTLRVWFDKAGIRRFQANPTAKNGGGTIFYCTADVERWLRSRTLPPSNGHK